MDEYSQTLSTVFNILWQNPNGNISSVPIYHSDVYYTRAAVNARFNADYSLDEIFDLMVEEGIIPEDKIELYGITKKGDKDAGLHAKDDDETESRSNGRDE